MSATRYVCVTDDEGNTVERIPWDQWLRDHPEFATEQEAFMVALALTGPSCLFPDEEHTSQ